MDLAKGNVLVTQIYNLFRKASKTFTQPCPFEVGVSKNLTKSFTLLKIQFKQYFLHSLYLKSPKNFINLNRVPGPNFLAHLISLIFFPNFIS